MIRRKLFPMVVVGAMAVVAGCASQGEVDQLKSEVAALRSDVNQLQAQMQSTQDAAMRAQESSERVERMFSGSMRK